MHKVSVLFPVKNGLTAYPPGMMVDNIHRTLHQPVHLEIIAVDNASTDGTFGKLCDLASHDARIKPFRNDKDEGIEYSLNRAAKEADGEYYIFQSARSYYDPGVFKKFVDILDRRPSVGFIYGQTRYYGSQSRTHTPPNFRPADFLTGFPSLFGFMYRAEAHTWCSYEWFLWKEDQPVGLCDRDFAMQLIAYAGYEGLALQDTLALHYYFGGQQNTNLIHKYADELEAYYTERWSSHADRLAR